MVKLHTPLGNSNKLLPKFKGPYKVVATDSGNKFKIRHLETGDISNSHADELKKAYMNEFDEHTPIDSEKKQVTLKHEQTKHKQKQTVHRQEQVTLHQTTKAMPTK